MSNSMSEAMLESEWGCQFETILEAIYRNLSDSLVLANPDILGQRHLHLVADKLGFPRT